MGGTITHLEAGPPNNRLQRTAVRAAAEPDRCVGRWANTRNRLKKASWVKNAPRHHRFLNAVVGWRSQRTVGGVELLNVHLSRSR